MITSKVLFAVHHGSSYGHQVGALSTGAWPLAMSDTGTDAAGTICSYEDIPGFWALWETVASAEEFGMCAFGGGDLDRPGLKNLSGLWVYEVEYDDPGNAVDDQDSTDPEFWLHLHRGEFRRPHYEELRQVCDSPDPVAEDRAWKVVL